MAVTINIPSQVKTYANLAAFPASGSLKTIYIAEDTNKTYRWDSSTYVEISASAETGLTVGTTPIASGTIGRVLFQGTGNVLQQSSSLFWDSTNNRLGIGTSTPESALDLFGSIGLGSASSVGLNAVSGRITFKNGANNTRIESVQIDGTFPQNQRLDFYPHTSNAAAFQIGFNNITSVLNHNFSANALLTALSSVTFAHSSGVSEGIRFDATTKRIRLNSFYVSIEGNTNEVFQATDGTNVLMRLRGNGNLLLNTTTDAGFRLDVNGTARVQTSLEIAGATGLTLGGGVSTLAYAGSVLNIGNSASWSDVRLFAGGVQKYAQSASLTTISNTTINLSTATVQLAGVNALTYSGTDIRIGSVAAGFNSLSMYVAGSERARIASTGNVGINTTTDAGFRLDVNGTARVVDNFSLGSGTGAFDIDLNKSKGGGVWSSVRNTLASSYSAINLGTNNTTSKLTIYSFGSSYGSSGQYQANKSLLEAVGDLFLTASNFIFYSGSVGVGTTTPNASALMDIASTTKGFLPPRMNTTQKNAIASPATGLQVYDTTLNRPCFYDGTTWITL